jgi:CubicO group peptidase (beta-lactamase class C family)
LTPFFVDSNFSALTQDLPEAFYGLWIKQNQELLTEYYGPKSFPDHTPQVYSASKSVAALLVGIALAQEPLAGLETRLIELFPEYDALKDERKSRITIAHCLSQTTGLRWLETGRAWGPGHDGWDMEHSADWIAYVFDREATAEPGTHFTYNTGVSHLLGRIVERLTGEHPEAFYRKHLSQALEFEGDFWETDNDGFPQTGKGLHLRLKDLAKIGQLLIQNGVYKGKQIVPAAWCQLVQQKHARGHVYYGEYGYHFWRKKLPNGPQSPENDANVICAIGFGGNFVFVIPAWNAVVAITGHLVGAGPFEIPQTLLKDRILPLLRERAS